MADAHVRPARAEDAEDIGRILVTTWQQAYASVLPESAIEALDVQSAAAAWRHAIAEPPSEGHHVFVAYERAQDSTETTVGFAAVTPPPQDEEGIDAPTAEIVALNVEPRWGRRGHGSRLVSAAVAVARGGGAEQMTCWVINQDKATASFLQSAGWDRDGWSRVLDAGEREITQFRFATDIRHA